jgi:hypothetical protein
MEGSDFYVTPLSLWDIYRAKFTLKKSKPTGKINLERDELLLKKLQSKRLKNLLRQELSETVTRGMLIPKSIIV